MQKNTIKVVKATCLNESTEWGKEEQRYRAEKPNTPP